jgi:peptide methionine sulfoxide reductase msrA/msrB
MNKDDKTFIVIFVLTIFLIGFYAFKGIKSEENKVVQNENKYNELTSEEKRVIIDKGTERPFTGEYYDFYGKGTYVCKRCDAPLYKSEDKFDSHCGWPSFDDEIPGAIKKVPDADGIRTEIMCNNCGAHLGHVFYGEGFTDKDTRHCVNSISMKFIPAKNAREDTAYYAGGCFWGIEHLFKKLDGVLSTDVGYMGGHVENPSYEEVCYDNTGHFEAIEIKYDADKIDYETLTKYFFEIHDPTQSNGQGPDIGDQYLSAIFYQTDEQKQTAEKLIGILKEKGYDVVTKLLKSDKFWRAEEYHQDYYTKTGNIPYCHFYEKKF